MTSLVDTVVYRDGKRIGETAVADIGTAMKQAGTFVWLGLHDPDDAVLREIQQTFGLHELAIEDAHHAHQRPKIEAYSDSLFIVLKTAQLQDSRVVYGETHLFVGTRFLVSVRHGASSSFAQVLQHCEDATPDLPKGPAFALYAILDFADISWTSATFTCRGALIYNSSKSNKSIFVLDFGTDKTVSSGTLTVQFPTANSNTAIAVISSVTN